MIKFPPAEFFDVFGLITFGVIVFISTRSLFFNIPLPGWGIPFLFFVGVAGIFIDGVIVYKTYLNRN